MNTKYNTKTIKESENGLERIPEIKKTPLFFILCTITFLFSMPYLFEVDLPVWLVLSLFSLFVIVTGIPHGAVDHIVAMSVYGLQNNLFDNLKFYSIYLFTMMLLGAVWIFSPISGFIIFIFISVYHFGQGDLSYLSTDMPLLSRTLIYISRGLFLVGLPILLHSDTTIPIIEAAILTDLNQSLHDVSRFSYNQSLLC